MWGGRSRDIPLPRAMYVCLPRGGERGYGSIWDLEIFSKGMCDDVGFSLFNPLNILRLRYRFPNSVRTPTGQSNTAMSR